MRSTVTRVQDWSRALSLSAAQTDRTHDGPPTEPPAELDVLIVGAGLSGIGLAHYMAKKRPRERFAIVDARNAVGGTWDQFRYPGVRSDSDLHTLGYTFKPWTRRNTIAEADEILEYLEEALDDADNRQHVYLGIRVVSANFDTTSAIWTVVLERSDTKQRSSIRARFLFSAAGYFSHTSGYSPSFAGEGDFTGEIVHPQHWPEALDYTGKHVVIIGSGATAVTMVPAMADSAASVTMLQRSPSYLVTVPRENAFANKLKRFVPSRVAWPIARRVSIARSLESYNKTREFPDAVRQGIRAATIQSLPKGYDVDTHFSPSYNPWDERLCAVPNGDFFAAISAGGAQVVTAQIERFTPHGIQLTSGEHLDADIIVTATGLRLQAFGAIQLSVDGADLDVHDSLVFKGFMVEGIPNFAFTYGYTNYSWTLKADLVSAHFCRLLAYMSRKGMATVVPVVDDPNIERVPFFDMRSGYIRRGMDSFPQQGTSGPWTLKQDYEVDRERLQKSAVDHPALHFSPAVRGAK